MAPPHLSLPLFLSQGVRVAPELLQPGCIGLSSAWDSGNHGRQASSPSLCQLLGWQVTPGGTRQKWGTYLLLLPLSLFWAELSHAQPKWSRTGAPLAPQDSGSSRWERKEMRGKGRGERNSYFLQGHKKVLICCFFHVVRKGVLPLYPL